MRSRALLAVSALVAGGCFDFGKFRLLPDDAAAPLDGASASDLAAAAPPDLSFCSIPGGNLLNPADSSFDTGTGSWSYGFSMTALATGCAGGAARFCRGASDMASGEVVPFLNVFGLTPGSYRFIAWVRTDLPQEVVLVASIFYPPTGAHLVDNTSFPNPATGWQRLEVQITAPSIEMATLGAVLSVRLPAASVGPCFDLDQVWFGLE